MRICTLISSYEGSSSPYSGVDPYPDPGRWLPEHDWSRALLRRSDVGERIEALAKEGYDVFVNLCDGEPGEDLVGIESILHLERLGQAFTGADSRFYARSRRELKRAYMDAGVGTPRYRFFGGAQGAAAGSEAPADAAEGLRFPLIVKPAQGYASVGITRESVVRDAAALRDRIERVCAEFGGALVEEFIEGREFTVLAIEPAEPGGAPPRGEPIVYPPLEVRFPPGETFKHFELKWRDYGSMGPATVGSAELDARLRDVAARTIAAVGATSYVRLDVRMDGRGELYVLDCNTNPGMFYPEGAYGAADLILSREPGGHAEFLRQIIARGLRRGRR